MFSIVFFLFDAITIYSYSLVALPVASYKLLSNQTIRRLLLPSHHNVVMSKTKMSVL